MLMKNSDSAAYLRYRLIEWLAWSCSLLLLGLIESIAHGSQTVSPSVLVSAMFDAVSLVAFSTVYAYVLFFYPLVSLAAYFVAKVLRRGKPIGSFTWLIVNVAVPLAYGLVVLLSIYGSRPDLLHSIALGCVVVTNALVTRRMQKPA